MSVYPVEERVNFSVMQRQMPYPDFLDVQLKSFHDFFQIVSTPEQRRNEGLYKVFSEVFPDQLTAEELGLFFPQDEAFQKRHAQIARYERIRKKHQEALAERKSGGSVVPRFFDSIRHPWSKYFDYIKPDRVAGGVDSSFIQFLYETYHVKNGMQLFALFAKRVFKRPE